MCALLRLLAHCASLTPIRPPEQTQAYFARLRRLYSSPAFVRRVEDRRRRRQRLYVDAMFERIPRMQFAFHTYPPHDPEAIYKEVKDPMDRALVVRCDASLRHSVIASLTLCPA